MPDIELTKEEVQEYKAMKEAKEKTKVNDRKARAKDVIILRKAKQKGIKATDEEIATELTAMAGRSRS